MNAKTTAAESGLPDDAPLLSIDDVARYLRLTPAAVRKALDGRADGSDGALGEKLRGWLVRLSPHRRYVKREPFLSWLRGLVTGVEEPVAGGRTA